LVVAVVIEQTETILFSIQSHQSVVVKAQDIAESTVVMVVLVADKHLVKVQVQEHQVKELTVVQEVV
jgi:hypothetical protein